ncbi:lysine-specific demethylase JMJ30 [Cannabis sativa]|uniref:lysine-specific demethylase JMJ30 n=1 Tax=Cannabis sativa TaxID=3483 RepID=UPI0029C9FEEB|nr:lysine-specific demethylase JMJ30 [Cannabis sativa]XP_030506202.2 lysine-specific demethylase JMJ30 [Cannabis sativa]
MSSAAATEISDQFETPILDAESSVLLHTISEHGGYAFVRMASQAEAGDFRAAEAAREMAWEQLHSGPWHSVQPAWRDAYSMACLRVAKLHFASGEFKEALRVLDMGLIMGGTLLRKDLDSAVHKVSSKARVSEAQGVSNGSSSSKSECELVHDGLNKAEILQMLPEKSLSGKTVVKRSGLSMEGFLREYLLNGLPVVINDAMTHWPAMTKWKDLDYLKTIAGDRTVPVEVGKNYLCSEWKQELITFSQFLERIRAISSSSSSSSAAPTYLAQHPLFDQINELRNDICVPDYCFAGGGEIRSLNAWFGPAGTVTPLHHDPHHNLLAQVVGKKYVRLYHSSISDELHPYTETMLFNSSKVDLDNIDEKVFPKVRDLEFVDCILEEGEMLYIPPKWWHYVRSLTTSFSVSFWWNDTENSTDS